MSSWLSEETPKLLNRLKSLVPEKGNEKEDAPKVANTYGVAVNPLTGKMERIKTKGDTNGRK
tara:strand:+ start:986 stop:1171 length:186 start_codon:yes stop_codon:yes gene_type:complete